MGDNVAETLEVMETMQVVSGKLSFCIHSSDHASGCCLLFLVLLWKVRFPAITGWLMRAGSQSHLLHNFLPEWRGARHHPSLAGIPSSPA